MPTFTEQTPCASNSAPSGISSYSSKQHNEKNSGGDTETQGGRVTQPVSRWLGLKPCYPPEPSFLILPTLPTDGLNMKGHKTTRESPPKFTIDGDKAGRYDPAIWLPNSSLLHHCAYQSGSPCPEKQSLKEGL